MSVDYTYLSAHLPTSYMYDRLSSRTSTRVLVEWMKRDIVSVVKRASIELSPQPVRLSSPASTSTREQEKQVA